MKNDRTLVFKVIWLALFATVWIYVGVVMTVIENPESRALRLPDLSRPLELGLLVVAAGTLAASFLLPALILAAARRRRGGPMGAATDVATGAPESEPAGPRPVPPAIFTSLMIRWALLESVTIYGLVIAFTTREPGKVLPFAAATALGFLASFPSEERIRATEAGF